jgi:ABC-type molybdate transport system ATPase subunit
MKANQAWGWLAAGVLAAGLNASYYDGGLQWVHRIADRVEQNATTVAALASGRADQFLSEARILTARTQTASCPLSTAMALVQSKIARSEAGFEVMSAREEAQLARFEASRARIEAQTARIRIPAAAFNPVVVRMTGTSVCPRIRVNVPRMPAIKMPPIPEIHIDTASAGPV